MDRLKLFPVIAFDQSYVCKINEKTEIRTNDDDANTLKNTLLRTIAKVGGAHPQRGRACDPSTAEPNQLMTIGECVRLRGKAKCPPRDTSQLKSTGPGWHSFQRR
jgi:hypothetical protein